LSENLDDSNSLAKSNNYDTTGNKVSQSRESMTDTLTMTKKSEHVVQIILLKEDRKMFVRFDFNKFLQLSSHVVSLRNRKQKKIN